MDLSFYLNVLFLFIFGVNQANSVYFQNCYSNLLPDDVVLDLHVQGCGPKDEICYWPLAETGHTHIEYNLTFTATASTAVVDKKVFVSDSNLSVAINDAYFCNADYNQDVCPTIQGKTYTNVKDRFVLQGPTIKLEKNKIVDVTHYYTYSDKGTSWPFACFRYKSFLFARNDYNPYSIPHLLDDISKYIDEIEERSNQLRFQRNLVAKAVEEKIQTLMFVRHQLQALMDDPKVPAPEAANRFFALTKIYFMYRNKYFPQLFALSELTKDYNIQPVLARGISGVEYILLRFKDPNERRLGLGRDNPELMVIVKETLENQIEQLKWVDESPQSEYTRLIVSSILNLAEIAGKM